MAKSIGKNVKVYANGYDLSKYLNSVEMSDDTEAVDSTTFDNDGWTEAVDGLDSASISASGYVWISNEVGSEGKFELRDRLANGVTTTTVLTPNGDVVGNPAYFIAGPNGGGGMGFSVGEMATVDLNVTPSGGSHWGRVLAPNATRTANGNGTTVDYGATAATELVAVLEVFALTGTTPTLNVTIEHSADGTTWAALGSFSQASGRGAQTIEVSGTVQRYLRATWTVSAGTTGATFHVSAKRK